MMEIQKTYNKLKKNLKVASNKTNFIIMSLKLYMNGASKHIQAN
jgi:hypothetical protein